MWSHADAPLSVGEYKVAQDRLFILGTNDAIRLKVINHKAVAAIQTAKGVDFATGLMNYTREVFVVSRCRLRRLALSALAARSSEHSARYFETHWAEICQIVVEASPNCMRSMWNYRIWLHSLLKLSR